MKVPVKWLKDYVSIDVTAKELGDALTLSGSQVEEVITSGDEIENVVTGRIIKIEPHPDADKLVVCQADIGEKELLQIVTGAKNMKEQDVVPVALHGSTIHGGVKIKKGKLRGVVSNGMFCSEEELGIAGDEPVHGLMILPTETPVGKDIKQVLGMDKAVIDFEITSNRPDCLSMVGMARETAATFNTSYRMPNLKYTPVSTGNVEDSLKVEVKDKLCRRYMARKIVNVKIGPSPAWMQERLFDAGVRPINNIVDITNFVMLELGQPMHAFDAREISSGKIVVERAKEGEKFTTLDGSERILDSNVLNIKNDETTVGIAGIMGGLNSEVKEDTTEIIFESANFEGTNIRISSKKLGLRTEASSRFEKDLDPEMAQIAINRACSLVQELKAGDILQGTIDLYLEKPVPRVVEVDSTWVNTFLGTQLTKESMKEYLDRLELQTVVSGNTLIVNAPSFRNDINIREDVAEEIARIYGYNNVPTTITKSVGTRDAKNRKQQLDDLLVGALIGSGLNQSISYSFTSPKVFDKIKLPEDSFLRKAIAIKNPLGEDFSIMRTTTLPSMLECLARNYTRNNEEAKLFEMGKVYIPDEDVNKLPKEINTVIIGLYGKVDYLDIKGIVENIIKTLGISSCSFLRETENPVFHPGKTASLNINKEKAGVLGEVHPDVADNYDMDARCYIAELNLDILYSNANTIKKYKEIPKFPAVTRDMAFILDEDILVQDIEAIIVKQGGSIVESVNLFDIYRGKQIPEGKKSIAYNITYRRGDRTLTDEEVNKVHDKILRTLENKLGAQLR